MNTGGNGDWLAAPLGGSGVLHLVRPKTYEWLVPPVLGDARSWVTVTGVAELCAAAALRVARRRQVVASTSRHGDGRAG